MAWLKWFGCEGAATIGLLPPTGANLSSSYYTKVSQWSISISNNIGSEFPQTWLAMGLEIAMPSNVVKADSSKALHSNCVKSSKNSTTSRLNDLAAMVARALLIRRNAYTSDIYSNSLGTKLHSYFLPLTATPYYGITDTPLQSRRTSTRWLRRASFCRPSGPGPPLC